jgi:4-amino-4-deoxy-L-arabinose transferase-like glycosyltransferase
MCDQRFRNLLGTGLGCTVWNFCILVGVSGYFLFFGLVPYFGGAKLGLVGADEPRYAQIAREMLAAHSNDCHEVHAKVTPYSLRPSDIHKSYECLVGGTVTPILYGQPWLEKPALYYWRAMGFFKEFGVSDWSARLPSASGAAFLILLTFLHLRRFRPGSHLDAALIAVSCIAIVSFARGASTDMQLAAPFCIGMLGWYAWYETGKKFWLFDLYFFNAAATLAKGPIAPFLALAIILLFVGLRREWSVLRRTIWIPGILFYFAMVLPWYIAVQRSNPAFNYQFFVEHNLERFATNRFQHHQPIYYYCIVLVLGLMPWTVIALRALVDALALSIAEWEARHRSQRYLGHIRVGDAFPEFLVLWAIVPIVFFSLAESKLPGYILPSILPIAILTGDYINRVRRIGIPDWLLISHAALTGILTFVLLLCPQYMIYEKLVPPARTIIWATILGVVAALLVIYVVKRFGVSRLRAITLVPVALLLFFLLEMNGHLLDLNYSARPLAQEIYQMAPDVPIIAVWHVRRDLEYGLSFYRDQEMVHYEKNSIPEDVSLKIGVPNEGHLLVLPTKEVPQLESLLHGRIYKPLFRYEWQGLSVYKVYPNSRGTPRQDEDGHDR